MEKILYKLIILAITIVIGSACVSTRQLEYMQSNFAGDMTYSTLESSDQIVKPGDQLYIRASSFDDISYNFFGSQASINQNNYSNETSLSLVTYFVDDSGYIHYPIVGLLMVKDLNENEVAQKLTTMLSSYFNQPTVLVKKVNKSIVVLGEVSAPGRYYYSQNRINIFEGLGMAGDITVHGKKNEVLLMRERDGTLKRWTINLNSDSIVATPQFYLESGDIVFVKSRVTALWSITASTYSLILSSITTIILILNYVQN